MSDGLPTLHVGDHVSDEQAPDATMLVTGISPTTADEYELDDGRTVADVNQDYPADDDVVEIVFPKQTDIEVQHCRRYAYPRSRLSLEEPIHDIVDESAAESANHEAHTGP